MLPAAPVWWGGSHAVASIYEEGGQEGRKDLSPRARGFLGAMGGDMVLEWYGIGTVQHRSK